MSYYTRMINNYAALIIFIREMIFMIIRKMTLKAIIIIILTKVTIIEILIIIQIAVHSQVV